MYQRRHSPGLFSVGGWTLWAGRSLALLRLGMRTIVLVVAFVEATVWSSSLWLGVLRHLGTGSKLLSLRRVNTHVWHWLMLEKLRREVCQYLTLSGGLLSIYWLPILHSWAHPVRLLPLLRATWHHHGRRASRAWVAVRACHRRWWPISLGCEVCLVYRIHHRWTRSHQIWVSNKRTGWSLNHNRATHVGWLLWHKLMAT